MDFEPDFRHMVAAARNQKPARLPLYEHAIAPAITARVLGVDMTEPPDGSSHADLEAYYRNICRFWREMTYDTVSFEAQICPILPDHGAIFGGRPGPVQNREDFERYPFEGVPERFWTRWTPHFEALRKVMPENMRALGGCGFGVFEISEDLVGYERLCLLLSDDPRLFADLYVRIGDLMMVLWSQMIERYGDLFAVYRMGDDLGFKTSTLLRPDTIVHHVLPQYRRIVGLAHAQGKPFLLHSCGCIFSVMDDIIATGIDAKHSNEDQIAPFARWVELYNDRIALFGGIDVNLLCTQDRRTVYEEVLRRGSAYRDSTRGFALGSGNSIPDYVPVENYLAMIDASRTIRRLAAASGPAERVARQIEAEGRVP